MSASKLVKPSAEYKESFVKALYEFEKEGRYAFMDIDDIAKDFETFVTDLNEGRRYVHKPYRDWVEPVPETILWMVKGKEYIGSFNIRHRLNWHLEKWGGHVNFVVRPSMRNKGFGKKLLQKGMPYVCFLGIDKALITVDPENMEARHIVEFCGGQFQDETQATERFPARRRYWLGCN